MNGRDNLVSGVDTRVAIKNPKMIPITPMTRLAAGSLLTLFSNIERLAVARLAIGSVAK